SLCTCFLVSKFWYKTLLPILWHGYWPDKTSKFIPSKAIARHSHLLMVLRLSSYNFSANKASLLGCTNLVELVIDVNRDQQNTNQIGLTEQQLLRSNPLLRKLHWSSVGDSSPAALDPEDFAGLKKLDSLLLDFWSCSDGRLARTLRNISGTLRRLEIGSVFDVKPEDFSAALLQEEHPHGYDTGLDDAEPGPMMDRLEWLKWRQGTASADCLIEFVKCCPNLKAIEVSPNEDSNLDRLAENLRSYCPQLETLNVGIFLWSPSLRSLLYRCSASGLRALHIATQQPKDDLVSGILHHASTLEDLWIFQARECADGQNYVRLLVECTKLKRFSFHTKFQYFQKNILETLRQERWRCRSLQELDVHLGFDVVVRGKAVVDEQGKQVTATTLAFDAGWEEVPFLNKEGKKFAMSRAQPLFDLLEFQELEGLKRLVLDGVPFRRIAHRSM
ncbi:hypothetical protein BGW39_002167, partial [Mortierella sp. 14UC]